MFRTYVRKLTFITLGILLACFALIGASRITSAGAPSDVCISQYNTCTSGCPIAIQGDDASSAAAAACEMGCMGQMSQCEVMPVENDY